MVPSEALGACSTIGVYRKSFPTAKELQQGILPSPDGVSVFDLDFGRVAVLICYDQQFAELWHAAGALGADVVFWPGIAFSTVASA